MEVKDKKVAEVEIPVDGAEDGKKQENKLMTRDEAAAAGLLPEEIDKAEKQGLISKPADLSADEKAKKEAEDKKKADEEAAKGSAGAAVTTPEKAKEIQQDAARELSEAEEREKLSKYNKNEQGLYWAAKKAVRRAQAAEKRSAELQKDIEALKKEISEIKAAASADDDDPDKMLTASDVKKREELKQKQADKENAIKALEGEDKTNKATAIDAALTAQEEAAKLKYDDFDTVMALADKVLQERLSTSAAVRGLYREFMAAAANPGKYTVETAADIMYQIGQMHPEYKASGNVAGKGKKDDDGGKGDDDKGGKKVDVKKILENAEKKGASAGVSGGTRKIPESELTLEQASKLPPAQYARLSKETRTRLERL